MWRDVVVSTIYHKGKSAKSELAITVFQLGERVKELIVSPCWCSHEWGARVWCNHTTCLASTDVKRLTIVLNIIELQRPEKLTCYWMPLDISNELILIIRSKEELWFILGACSHIEGEDVPIEETLLDHTVEYRKSRCCHGRVSQTNDSVIVIVKYMFLYYQTNGLV